MAATNSNEETSVTEGEYFSGATKTSSRNKKQPKRFGDDIPTTLLKKGEDMIYREDQNLEFILKVRYNQNFLT